MAFHDRLGDRKAQAGMPAEVFPFRTYGMESVKDRFPRLGWNPRATGPNLLDTLLPWRDNKGKTPAVAPADRQK